MLGPGEENTSVLRPYGVWAVISPFNFPLALAAGKDGPLYRTAVAGLDAVVFGDHGLVDDAGIEFSRYSIEIDFEPARASGGTAALARREVPPPGQAKSSWRQC